MDPCTSRCTPCLLTAVGADLGLNIGGVEFSTYSTSWLMLLDRSSSFLGMSWNVCWDGCTDSHGTLQDLIVEPILEGAMTKHFFFPNTMLFFQSGKLPLLVLGPRAPNRCKLKPLKQGEAIHANVVPPIRGTWHHLGALESIG